MPTRPFSVYIIESPSGEDLYHQRSEAQRLQDGLDLIGIQSTSRAVDSRARLEAAIAECTEHATRGWTPLALHVSSHGGSPGIQLTDNNIVTWNEFRDLLAPLSKATNGDLLVCMSSCQGVHGVKMAMDFGPLPFSVIVGPTEQLSYADTAIAFLAFYHLVAKGYPFDQAVSAMSLAAGQSFTFVSSEVAKDMFMKEFYATQFNNSLQSMQ